MAKEENMSEGSMRNLVKKDLGMTPYKKIRLQLLSEATIEKRRERGRILLNKLKSGTQGPVFYTDEKLFRRCTIRRMIGFWPRAVLTFLSRFAESSDVKNQSL
ncbi:Uncharacterized protein FKW44_000963 [Caligus rogercresseyi]|uniref:Uncharacterized protein n=1 Tax=Caligus rogercresseyi TaxID=217165 RepID=A0A7T8QV82_CALRO|nr:Uncharacterized protein FKW44_000963 [Caligus rogercresseyi]